MIAAALDTCWKIERNQARMVLIPNTLEIASFWVSAAMAEEVEADVELRFETDFLPIPFDERDNLEQERLFPKSQRGRRSR